MCVCVWSRSQYKARYHVARRLHDVHAWMFCTTSRHSGSAHQKLHDAACGGFKFSFRGNFFVGQQRSDIHIIMQYLCELSRLVEAHILITVYTNKTYAARVRCPRYLKHDGQCRARLSNTCHQRDLCSVVSLKAIGMA